MPKKILTLHSVLYLELVKSEDPLTALKEIEKPQSEAVDDAHEEPARESSDILVKFIQSSFNEYLQKLEGPIGLFSSRNKTKVSIFSMLCKVMCGADQMKSETRTVLQDYAVKNFLAHLMDIDVDAAGKEETEKVIEGLAQVMTNTNGVCQIIESVLQINQSDFWRTSMPGFELYEATSNPRSSDGSRPPRTVITTWASKVRYHGSENLTIHARKWVKQTVQTGGSRLLHTLIRGHVLSWFTKVTQDEAWLSFKLVCEALFEVSYDLFRRNSYHSANCPMWIE